MQKKDPRANNQQLGNLIERYKKILKPPQQSVIKEVIEVVKEVVKLQIDESKITYTVSSRTIHFQISGLLKTEIKKHQAQIIQKLTERLGEQNCPKMFF